MKSEILSDAEDGGVGEQSFVDIEEGIVDGDQRKNEEVDFADQFSLLLQDRWVLSSRLHLERERGQRRRHSCAILHKV